MKNEPKYELLEGDHGMGNMGDYKGRIIAYFSTLEKAYKFFQDNDITVDYNNKHKEFDLDTTFYIKDKHRGLGVKDYKLLVIKKPRMVVDPEKL